MKKPIIDNRIRKPNSDRDLRKISIHVKKRFKERFEYPLSDEELVEIENLKTKLNGFKWTSSIPTPSPRAIVGIADNTALSSCFRGNTVRPAHNRSC